MKDGTLHLRIKNQLTELEPMAIRVEEFVEERGLSPKTAQEINLCLDEVVTNIVSYAYPEDGEHVIDVRMEAAPGRIVIEIEDEGVPFNPLEAAAPDVTKPIEERGVGGLGIFFVRKLMTDVSYERKGARNLLTLVKQPASGPAR